MKEENEDLADLQDFVIKIRKNERQLCIKVSDQRCPGTSYLLQLQIHGKWIIDIPALQISRYS